MKNKDINKTIPKKYNYGYIFETFNEIIERDIILIIIILVTGLIKTGYSVIDLLIAIAIVIAAEFLAAITKAASEPTAFRNITGNSSHDTSVQKDLKHEEPDTLPDLESVLNTFKTARSSFEEAKRQVSSRNNMMKKAQKIQSRNHNPGQTFRIIFTVLLAVFAILISLFSVLI